MGNVGLRSAEGEAKEGPLGTGLQSGEDDELVRACNQFLAAHDACVKLRGDGESPSAISEAHQHRVNAQRRADALREVNRIAPNTSLGLEAKFGVLCALRIWMANEDPRLATFAIRLVEDYRTYQLRHMPHDESGVRPPRSNGLLPPLRGISRILRDSLHFRAPA